ncbi:hypothetical protein [Vibrio sonorensis]|uniref:hypothetical protein n=1 Tax=Vibrio sonorensis TaxID=1004316 RepID=UPI0008D95D42|nr:hypothetical protein [Vibrio sonorensis]
MRVSPARRRRWNNILILAVIAFMAVLNLPTIIQSYLIEEPVNPYPTLLSPNLELQALHTNHWSLEKNQGRWRLSVPSATSPEDLASRWQVLVGTEVDATTFEQLRPNLGSPESLEIWYKDVEEPQRTTLYQTDKFWLLDNWQGNWIAISVEKDYLFPPEILDK